MTVGGGLFTAGVTVVLIQTIEGLQCEGWAHLLKANGGWMMLVAGFALLVAWRFARASDQEADRSRSRR
jgi:high-affinity Fe2+/Pb2+ permease